MADLTFFYGTMECGKTTKLLQDNYNYIRHGHKVVIVKPLLDKKGGNTVVSRNTGSANVDILIDKDDSFLSDNNINIFKEAKVILVDEAQFIPEQQIKELWMVAHIMNISVVCYGLKSDFLGRPFDGTRALLGYADIKHELTVNCLCGKEAIFNARMVDGKFTQEGDVVAIDGFSEVSYVPLCGECYLDKVIKNSENAMVLKLEKVAKKKK